MVACNSNLQPSTGLRPQWPLMRVTQPGDRGSRKPSPKFEQQSKTVMRGGLDRACTLLYAYSMPITLGDRLRQLRDQRDLSLRELAKQLGGVTAAHLSDIEFGRRYPSDDLLAKLAGFFHVGEAELRTLDTRPPVDEIRRLAQADPAFGIALRRLVDKEVTPEQIMKLTDLGGHPKTGQWWSPQNRPIESSQDKGIYSAVKGVSARFFCEGASHLREAVAN